MSTSKRQHWHERSKVAIDRPKYRDGNRDRAVKVFTINNESVYILIQGVPDIKITRELLELCSLYGAIDEYRILDDYPTEPFTKVYWIKYQQIQAARVAKRKIDDHSFYGGVLHVCYAPEYETVSDTRLKLQERRKAVARRLRQLEQEGGCSKKVNQHEDKTSNLTTPSRPSGPAHGEENDTNDNESEVPYDGKFGQEAKQPVHVQGSSFPALPDPPRQLPFEKWKHQKPGSDDPKPRVPSAHSTLPRNFNPYPVGHRPPGPPQRQLQGTRIPEQNQCNSWQQSKHQKPDPRSHTSGNAGVCHQAPGQQTVDVKRQDIKLVTESLVPRQVPRKRTSAQANLSNTSNEHGKRLNSGQVVPSRTGITFYRQGKSDAYGQPSVSNQTLDESCSFNKTVESIRNKMKMVSKAPSQAASSSSSPSSAAASSSERIRI